VETARSLLDPSMANLTFEVGSIYQPRFAAGSFDAVFAHQVLQHLARPVEALVHMHRLLKPGGVVGVRDVDWGSATFYPQSEGMRRFLGMYYELARRNGGGANARPPLRGRCRGAGVASTKIMPSPPT